MQSNKQNTSTKWKEWKMVRNYRKSKQREIVKNAQKKKNFFLFVWNTKEKEKINQIIY